MLALHLLHTHRLAYGLSGPAIPDRGAYGIAPVLTRVSRCISKVPVAG